VARKQHICSIRERHKSRGSEPVARRGVIPNGFRKLRKTGAVHADRQNLPAVLSGKALNNGGEGLAVVAGAGEEEKQSMGFGKRPNPRRYFPLFLGAIDVTTCLRRCFPQASQAHPKKCLFELFLSN